MSSSKPRIRPRISSRNFLRLLDAARCDKTSQSVIVDKALSALFSYDIDDNRDAAILRRLDKMSDQNRRLKADMVLLNEMQALFIQYFFTMTREIKDADSDARGKIGAVQFNGYLDQLGIRMKGGGKTVFRALEEVLVDKDDFMTKEELLRLKARTVSKKPAKREAAHVSA